MIDDLFRKEIESNKGCAIILAGSSSDAPHIEKLINALNHYNIPTQVHIASAHKQPERVLNLLKSYDHLEGSLAYIAVAGATDALSGIVSYHSTRPVISSPPDNKNLSCIGNPPGSSNAYIARPQNVARFIAQMFSHNNFDYGNQIRQDNADKEQRLLKFDLQKYQNKE